MSVLHHLKGTGTFRASLYSGELPVLHGVNDASHIT